eukprot:CAMPEP_0201738606 /NCGR_PEP_ID=MMETSP0593-20130828/45343_1 /ASSEMBLY_ACC=CAM_ASM_000672 /TAXON_ID=267983 /ORGANISM="Skeletonema japonicum, Strain CCMP2506" /LENGTH=333 /DNA_ID=CAMNT_0048232831 /DNA_START=104 /DNA_END=1105 /DNA_ORIENTATION=+
MKWTANTALTVLLTQFTDQADAKIGRIIAHDRQLQDKNYYYPLDITKGICSDDPTTRPSSYTEINFTLFETREECCDKWYSWQQGGNCARNEQTSVAKEVEPASSAQTAQGETVFFYPMDLITGKCSSDASQRPNNFDSLGFTLFFTLEQCCDKWYGWQEDQFCLLNTSADPPKEPQVSTVPPVVTPDGGANGGDNSSGDDGDGGDSNPPVVVVPKEDDPVVVVVVQEDDPVVGQEDDPVVGQEDDPVVVETEQFYLANQNCYSTANGLTTTGTLYSTRFECCTDVEKDFRMSCLRSKETTPPNPNPAKSSASQLKRGTYAIAAAVCLYFQFI